LKMGNKTVDDNGFWAEQAKVSAGENGFFGAVDDNVQLSATYPAGEHGNPIAAALIAYYRWTHSEKALAMLNSYGSWLVRSQIKTGQFAGAFPVTQYYWKHGWQPRMYETTESTWILCELYTITGNQEYLDAAIMGGDYMLSRQFVSANDTHIQGALPYEWNRTQYSRVILTNHAGFTIQAWTKLYRLTGNSAYLVAAQKYANWLLNMQVTTPDTEWGDHRYANDSMAIGGYYYGYDADKHEFGWRVALSLWSSAHAIPGFLALGQLVNDSRYFRSALLAADWLAKMRFTDQTLIPLQALAIIKYSLSSWWGKYPQFYQPDMQQIENSGMIKYSLSNPLSIANPKPSWFERTFGVDFNMINYQMINRGVQYMKMIWSWWPNVGFEPRYGGDIASGAFPIAAFLAYRENAPETESAFLNVQRIIRTQRLEDSPNITRTLTDANELLKTSKSEFDDGYYTIAVVKLRSVGEMIKKLNPVVKILQEMRALRNLIEILIASIVGIATIFTICTIYLRRLTHTRVSKNIGQYCLSAL